MVEIRIREFKPSDLPQCHSILVAGYNELRLDSFRDAFNSCLSYAIYSVIALTALFDQHYRYILLGLFIWIIFTFFHVRYLFLDWNRSILSSDMKSPEKFYQSSADSNFWIAEFLHDNQSGNRVIGMIGLKSADGIGEIQRLSVSKSYRRYGAASLLMAELIKFARSRGLTRLELETSRNQHAAINLYRRRYGFHYAGITESDWGWINFEVFKMIKLLNSDELNTQ